MKEWTAGDGLLLCWSLAEWCCWQPRVQQRYYSNSRINPDAGKSGTINFVSCKPDARATPSAAMYPLRTAPSMVAGHPVATQSPARNTRGRLSPVWDGRDPLRGRAKTWHGPL